MASNYGLLWIYYRLFWGIVACYFRLLGVPGTLVAKEIMFRNSSELGGQSKRLFSSRNGDGSAIITGLGVSF